jgi:hypothetical protein
VALVLTKLRRTGVSLAVVTVTACASVPARFSLEEPVLRLDDRRPIRQPRSSDVEGEAKPPFVLEPDVPLVHKMSGRRAADVNALDETVESVFYTARIARGALGPEEIERGPGEGPPELPLAVSEVREAAPELLVRDRRGRRYDLRFDAKDRAEVGSGADAVASRLFWAFGLEVAAQHVVLLRAEDLVPEDGVAAPAIAASLADAARSSDGRYRGGATRIPEGVALGPLSPRGIRGDDPNDRIAHEARRALRALRVLTAWVDLPEIGRRQTVDVYAGEPGQGFVRHWFAYLDAALGAARLGQRQEDAAIGRYGDFVDVLENFLTLGLWVRPWERPIAAPWPGVGGFESQVFEFPTWRPAFVPIRRSEADDDYWAAKLLMHFGEDQIRAAVAAARLQTPASAEYVVRTLLERRRKIVEAAFARVTPLEVVEVGPGRIVARDPRDAAASERLFELCVEDAQGRELSKARVVEAAGRDVIIESDHLPGGTNAAPYIRLLVRSLAPVESDRPVELHVARAEGGAPRLVGVLH